MRSSLRKSIWTALFLSPSLLVPLNIYLFRTEVDLSPVSVSSAAAEWTDAAAVADEAVIRDSLQLSQTLARPLFSPTRREFAPEAKPVEQAAPVVATQAVRPITRPAIAFQGTRIIGQERHALVLVDGTQASEWLPVGGKVAEWTIVEIGPVNLTLAQEDESVSYELFEIKGSEQNATDAADGQQLQRQ